MKKNNSKFLKKYYGYILIALSPILINYLLLTWHFPGAAGDAGDWIGFFGSFLGVISAVGIANYQFIKQKQKDDEQERKNYRSYVTLFDFNAPFTMDRIKTHENSRIMLTDGYKYFEEMMKRKGTKNVSLPFLKMEHFGISEVILDCHVKVNIRYDVTADEMTHYNFNLNIGVIEKGIEVFIPLYPEEELTTGLQFLLDKVVVDYRTLKNERLRLTHDLQIGKDKLELLDDSGLLLQVLYEYDLLGMNWIYPNKLDKKSTPQ